MRQTHTLTIGESITLNCWSGVNRYMLHPKSNIFCCLLESKPVKLETSRKMILSLKMSYLWWDYLGSSFVDGGETIGSSGNNITKVFKQDCLKTVKTGDQPYSETFPYRKYSLNRKIRKRSNEETEEDNKQFEIPL